MGFLSDALSGKIYKHNVLIGENSKKLLSKIKSLPEESFARWWIYAAVAGIDGTLSKIIFDDPGEYRQKFWIKKDERSLKTERVFELYKLFVIHYLASFFQNKYNVDLLKKSGTSEKDLIDEVMSIFEFRDADREVYGSLASHYKDDSAKYFVGLYTESLARLYEKSADEVSDDGVDLTEVMVFTEVIVLSYKVFLEALSGLDQIKDARRASFFSSD